jgi:hypothetical protein
MPVVAFLLFAVLFGLVLYASYAINKKRRQELAAWGERQGLRFSADDPFDIPERFSQFGLMKQGHSHKAMNVLWREGGIGESFIFQYSYITGSGKEQTTHSCCACSWQLPVALGSFVIRPEGFFDHVAAWFGHDRIEFESTEFNKRFHVAGTDKKEVYAVITPQMMEFIMARDLDNLEVRGQRGLCHQEVGLTVQRAQWLLEAAEGFTKNIPEMVIHANGGQTG